MLKLQNYNPAVLLVYFLSVAGVAMFVMHPLVLIIAFVSAFSLFIAVNGVTDARSHLFYFLFFVILALINPLFNHRGQTILFFINDNPVTLEAFAYGVFAALMIMAVIYWFRCLSVFLTTDKLLYLFGSFAPKFALLLSMTFRMIPLFKRQSRKIKAAQKTSGKYREDSFIDSIKSGAGVFSILLTWGLENGIITADSMEARGYGSGRRTNFSIFRFRKTDAAALLVILSMLGIFLLGAFNGCFTCSFYPAVKYTQTTATTVLSSVAYGILAFLPTLLVLEERIRWKSLISKI